VGSEDWGFSVWAHNAECAIVQMGDEHVLVDRMSRQILYRGKSYAEVADHALDAGHTLHAGRIRPDQVLIPEGNPNAPRPVVKNPAGSDPKVTHELPLGQERTVPENGSTRKYFENHKDKAKEWWQERWGRQWPEDATHAEHPRAIKEGGDPLFIEPGFGGAQKPHTVVGSDGLTDAQRWGIVGGKTGGRGRPKQQ
jgi:hypothetical protein